MRNATRRASRTLAPGAACASHSVLDGAVALLRRYVRAAPLTTALVTAHLIAGIRAPHVLGHGLALLVVGRLLEPALGPMRFAAVYVGAIVVSSNLNHHLGWEWRGPAAAGLYALFGALLPVTVCADPRRALLVWVFVAAAVLRDLTPGGIAAFVTSHVVSVATGVLVGIFVGPGAEIRSPVTAIIAAYTPTVQGAVRVRRPRRRFWRRGDGD